MYTVKFFNKMALPFSKRIQDAKPGDIIARKLNFDTPKLINWLGIVITKPALIDGKKHTFGVKIFWLTNDWYTEEQTLRENYFQRNDYYESTVIFSGQK